MKKAEFLEYIKALRDTNARIAENMTIGAEHRALAAERFALLLSLLPAAEALEEPAKVPDTAEGVIK